MLHSQSHPPQLQTQDSCWCLHTPASDMLQVGNLAHAVAEALHPHSQALQSKSCTQLLPLQCVPAGQEKQATPLSPQELLLSLRSQAPAGLQQPFVQFCELQGGQSAGKVHCCEVVHQDEPATPHGLPHPSNPPHEVAHVCGAQVLGFGGMKGVLTSQPPSPTPEACPSSNQPRGISLPLEQLGGPEPVQAGTPAQVPKRVFPVEVLLCERPHMMPPKLSPRWLYENPFGSWYSHHTQ
jgi:hypothetical protein